MKKILSLFLISIISIVLCGCLPKWWDNIPSQQQENTRWVSDDERIELYCVNGFINGYLNVDDKKIMIYARINRNRSFVIYEYDYFYPPDDFENWNIEKQDSCFFEFWDRQVIYESGYGTYRKNSFTVKFDQTTYFEPGEKITFHKVEWTELPEDFIVSTDEE